MIAAKSGFVSHCAAENTEVATAKQLDLLIDTQRRQVAHHTGSQWRALLDYLSGKLRQLPEHTEKALAQ